MWPSAPPHAAPTPRPLIAFSLLYVAVGTAVGLLLGKVLRYHGHDLRFFVSTVAFANTTSVPLAIVEAVVRANEQLRGGLTEAQAERQVTTYVLVVTLVMNFLRWSVGYRLLSPPEAAQLPQPLAHAPPESPASPAGQDATAQLTMEVDDSGEAVRGQDQGIRSATARGGCSMALLWLWRAARGVTAPVWAALLAALLGSVAPLHDVFFGPDAPLGPSVTDAVAALGSAYLPMVLLVLGANLRDGPSGSVSRPMLAASCFAKLVVVPALCMGMWMAAKHAGILGPAAPLRDLVLLLESAGPTAINMMVICSVQRHHEREMASVLFFSYLCAALTLNLWLPVFFAAMS